MKILKQLSFTVFICFFSNHFCFAQKITLVQKNYVYENIGTGSSTSDWAHYFLIEGESTPRKAGYFGQHLKKYIQSDPDAVKYLNSYATRQTFKLTTTISTVVLFSTFAISNLSAESVAVENLDKPEKNRGLLYASFGTLAANLALRIFPPKSIRKAVDSYNKTKDKNTLGFNGFNFTIENISETKIVTIGVKLGL